MKKPSRPPYLDSQSGWRTFVIGLLVAAIIGMGFRLYFSPQRLKTWAQAAIEQKKKSSNGHPFALSFERAEISLARGWLPEFAFVLRNLKVAPRSDCRPEASISIGRLRLPLRLRSLAIGRAAVGVVTADDLVVDLDGLRAPCEAKPAAGTKSPADESDDRKVSVKPAMPWWTRDEYETARANVEGIEFTRATLQFENHTKEVYLDSFEALFKGDGRVSVETEMRIPPAVAFNETLPPLRIDGEATSAKANLAIRLRVSEGSLITRAEFTPAENETVHIVANLDVKSLPLSMITPLMRRSSLVDEKFNPRFLWLDCEAAISGPFQGLFENRPLTLNRCKIEGDGTDLRISSASRGPDGTWSPFTVDLVSLDVAKLLATIGVDAPDGVLAKDGRLQGKLEYRKKDDAVFMGTLRGIEFIFSNQSVRALQRIEAVGVQASVLKDRLVVELTGPEIRDGVLDATAKGAFTRPSLAGSMDIAVKKLVLSSAVQNVLVGGPLGALTGVAKIEFADQHLSRLTSFAHIGETQGKIIRFERLDIKSGRAKDDGPRINFETPAVQINRASWIFQALQPAFLGHEFSDEWVTIKKFRGEITAISAASDDASAALLEWRDVSGSLENGQIQIDSHGRMSRDRKLAGVFEVDFPSVKKLSWQIGGSTLSPSISGESEAVKKFKARVDSGDSALGLKQK